MSTCTWQREDDWCENEAVPGFDRCGDHDPDARAWEDPDTANEWKDEL